MAQSGNTGCKCPNIFANTHCNKFGHCVVWPDWAIYWALSNFSKPLATINLPKSPTFWGNFCKCVKKIQVKSFLGNFYWHLATFDWSHWLSVTVWLDVGIKSAPEAAQWYFLFMKLVRIFWLHIQSYLYSRCIVQFVHLLVFSIFPFCSFFLRSLTHVVLWKV